MVRVLEGNLGIQLQLLLYLSDVVVGLQPLVVYNAFTLRQIGPIYVPILINLK